MNAAALTRRHGIHCRRNLCGSAVRDCHGGTPGRAWCIAAEGGEVERASGRRPGSKATAATPRLHHDPREESPQHRVKQPADEEAYQGAVHPHVLQIAPDAQF
jgi:hypothetical protein